jgi:hypothetical protein
MYLCILNLKPDKKLNWLLFINCVGPEPKPDLPGQTRTYRVWLDPNQYQQDMAGTLHGKEVH